MASVRPSICVTPTRTASSFIATGRSNNGRAVRMAVWRCSRTHSILTHCSKNHPETLALVHERMILGYGGGPPSNAPEILSAASTASSLFHLISLLSSWWVSFLKV